MPLIVDHDNGAAETLKGALGGEASVLTSVDALRRHLDTDASEDCVVLGPGVDQVTALRLAEELRLTRPTLGVVLVRRRIDTGVLGDALRAGVREVVDARDLSGLTAAVRRTRALARALSPQRHQRPPSAEALLLSLSAALARREERRHLVDDARRRIEARQRQAAGTCRGCGKGLSPRAAECPFCGEPRAG